MRLRRQAASLFPAISLLMLVACAGESAVQNRFGTFRDARDGREYATVRIGQLEWMRENANFASQGSWCYDHDDKMCDRYGRLYPYSLALNACPEGWHVAIDEEWMQLESAIGIPEHQLRGTKGRGDPEIGVRLRKGGDTGFDLELGGYRALEGHFECREECTALWTGSEAQAGFAWHRDIDNGKRHRSGVYRSAEEKEYALSVRCARPVEAGK